MKKQKAIIYKKTKNVMQSGVNNTKLWHLKIISPIEKQQENLMGWPSSLDTQDQVMVSFHSLEEAVEYANHNDIGFEIKSTNDIHREKKSYTFNLTKDRNLYYY